MQGYIDKVTQYYWWQASSSEEVVIASQLSLFYNKESAVDASKRYPWCVKNPHSLWMASLHGRIELIVQLHALFRPLGEIWTAGRVKESHKTTDDVLEPKTIRMTSGPLTWYQELALFHNDALERHASLAKEGLRRGVAWIIASMRLDCRNDTLLKLAIDRPRDDAAIESLSLQPLGIRDAAGHKHVRWHTNVGYLRRKAVGWHGGGRPH